MRKRILVIGEFSAVGTAFVDGIKNYDTELEVDHLTDGDGYKGLSKKTLAKYSSARYIYLIFQALYYSTRKYDYAIWLSPFVFKRPLFLIKILNNLLLRICKINVVYNCTTDSVYWRHYNLNLNRKSLLGFLHDTDFKPHRFSQKKYYDYNLTFSKKMDHVFSASEEYYFPYKDVCTNYILRYPIITDGLVSDYPQKDILHYHGITRPGIKGTKYILELLSSQGIESKISEKISFKQFIANLRKTVFYYDQYHSIFPGIAGLLSLFYCPYVYSGIDRNLIIDKIYAKNCPIIDLQTEYQKIKFNFSDTKMFKEKLKENRLFLKENHDPKNIVSLMFKYIHETS